MNDDDKYYQVIGERIANRRRDLGIRQEELAQRINLTRVSTSNIEMGRQRTAIHTLYRIAEALNVTIHDLLPAGTLEVEAYATRVAIHNFARSTGLDPVENEQELKKMIERIDQLKKGKE